MKVIIKKIDQLKEAEYNPRILSKEQYKHLKASLEEFGFVEPIVINSSSKRKGTIIGGHQRVKVARDIGLKEVPCVEMDLGIGREKELNIRLNRNLGEWDWDLLANNFDMEDLEDWGFNEGDFAHYNGEDMEEKDNTKKLKQCPECGHEW